MERVTNLQFSNCVMGDGVLYGFLDDGGYPIEIDLQTKEVSVADLDKGLQTSIHVDSLLYNDQMIYILELDGRCLIQYNIRDKQLKYYSIHYKGGTWGNFAFFTQMQQSIYIFPKRADCLIEIDLQNERVEKKAMQLHNAQDVRFSCAFRNENEVCLFDEDAQKIWIYDLRKKIFRQGVMEQEIECLATAAVFKDKAYLLGEKGSVYLCRLADYSIDEIRRSRVENVNFEWGNIAATEKNIWLLPALGESICIINRENFEERVFTEYPNDFEYANIEGYSKFYGYGEDEGKYYFAPRLANYMLEIDKNSGSGEWIKLINPLKKDLYDAIQKNLGIINEGPYNALDLKDFLSLICNKPI